MIDFRAYYKKKTLGFGNSDESRFLRAERQAENRKDKRDETFAKSRAYTENEHSSSSHRVESAQVDRRAKLMKWKEERDLKKKLQQQVKKPVFRVGIVHHSLNSPVYKDTSNLVEPHHSKLCKVVQKQPTLPRRTTRATEKRLAAKLAAGSQLKVVGTSAKQTSKSKTGTSKTKVSKEVNVSSTRKSVTTKSFAPENYKFMGPPRLLVLPPFGQGALQSEKHLQNEKISSLIAVDRESTIAFPKTSLHFITPIAKSFIKAVLSSQKKKGDQECGEVSTIDNKSNNIEKEEVEGKAKVKTSSKPCINDMPASNSLMEAVSSWLSSNELDNSDCKSKGTILNTNMFSQDNSKLTMISPKDTTPAPASFSPYIVCSREKCSARKEQIRLGIGYSATAKIPTMDTLMKNSNECVEEEERTSHYFKYILDQAVERLTKLCVKWTEIKSGPDITEDAQYQVNQAIGQTNLLMQNKLKRFKELVLDCEIGKGERLVTHRDLQGFRDLVCMDITNCDFRFGKLEELKSKGWVEEQSTIVKQIVQKKTVVKKQVISRKQSSLRAMILAEKKRKRGQRDSKVMDANETVIKDKEQGTYSSELNIVQFDGSFFIVASPRRSVSKSGECNSYVSYSTKKKDQVYCIKHNYIKCQRILKAH